MKYLFTLFFILTISLNSYAQTSFEKGYFIDNVGKKVDCLIKNIDSRSNPSQFNYKLSDASEVKTGYMENIQEFGISDSHKYKRFTVDIDRSKDQFQHLT